MARVHALGRLYVRGSRGLLTGAAADARRLAMLGLLAANAQRGVPRETLMDFLWPDAGPDRGREFLDQAIAALRQDLGVDPFLESDTLRLDPAVISSDLAEFEQAVCEGNLEMAESRYSGPFLDGFHVSGAPKFLHWTEEVRAELARTYAMLLELLAARSTRREDFHTAVHWWRTLAAQDPLNPRITLQLMQALESAGDRANAIRQARVYEVLIQQRLDSEPDRQVVAFAWELRCKETDMELSPS